MASYNPTTVFSTSLPSNLSEIAISLKGSTSKNAPVADLEVFNSNGVLLASKVESGGLKSTAVNILIATHGASKIYVEVTVPTDVADFTAGNKYDLTSQSNFQLSFQLTYNATGHSQASSISSVSFLVASISNQSISSSSAGSSSPGVSNSGVSTLNVQANSLPNVASTPSSVNSSDGSSSTSFSQSNSSFESSSTSAGGGLAANESSQAFVGSPYAGSMQTLTSHSSTGILGEHITLEALDPSEAASGAAANYDIVATASNAQGGTFVGQFLLQGSQQAVALAILQTNSGRAVSVNQNPNGFQLVVARRGQIRTASLQSAGGSQAYGPLPRVEYADAEETALFPAEGEAEPRQSRTRAQKVDDSKSEYVVPALESTLASNESPGRLDRYQKQWRGPVLLAITGVLGLGLHLPEIAQRMRRATKRGELQGVRAKDKPLA